MGMSFRANGAGSRKSLGLSSARRCSAGLKRAVRPQMGCEPARHRDAAAHAPPRAHQPELPQLHGDVSVFCRGRSSLLRPTGVYNELTHRGSIAYICGRIAYTILYISGVPLIRSLFWNIAAFGMLAVLAAPFVPG